jgi:hypothetical protein
VEVNAQGAQKEEPHKRHARQFENSKPRAAYIGAQNDRDPTQVSSTGHCRGNEQEVVPAEKVFSYRCTRPLDRTIKSAAQLPLVVLALLVRPVLPVPQFLAYHLYVARITPVVFEDEPERPLPRYLADKFGWEPMTQKIAEVFHGLFFSFTRYSHFRERHGEAAAAIDFFGHRYGCPH